MFLNKAKLALAKFNKTKEVGHDIRQLNYLKKP